jgi:hypothetical protein
VAMAASQVKATQSWFGRSWSGGASHGELREARQSSQGAGGTASRGGYGMEAQGSLGTARRGWLGYRNARQSGRVRSGLCLARQVGLAQRMAVKERPGWSCRGSVTHGSHVLARPGWSCRGSVTQRKAVMVGLRESGEAGRVLATQGNLNRREK